MKRSTSFIGLTLAVTLAAFFSAQAIWPNPPDAVQPEGLQLPLLIFYSFIDALALGLGISFLFFGYPLVKKLNSAKKDTWVLFFGISWLLISWWPHDHFHRFFGHDNLNGLLALEYGFHATIILVALYLARWFWKNFLIKS